MIKKTATIIGSGSHCRSIIGILNQTNEYKILEILDLFFESESSEKILNIPVKPINKLETYKKMDDIDIFLAIGDNNLRKSWYEKLINKFNLPNLISPSALIDKNATLGISNVICSNAYIGPEASIGNNNIINSGSIIEHEAKISDHCHAGPASVICGRSKVARNCFLGANSTIIENIKIAENTIIGAGSTLVNSILNKNGIYTGSPAKLHRENK